METTDVIDPDYNNVTYYGAVTKNPAWKAWGKVAHEYGYDWDESVETGWLGESHFQTFLNWYKNIYEIQN